MHVEYKYIQVLPRVVSSKFIDPQICNPSGAKGSFQGSCSYGYM